MGLIVGLPPEAKAGQLVCMDVETFGQQKKRIHRPEGTFACLSIRLEGDENTYQIYDSHDVKKVLSLAKKGTWVFHNSLYDLTQLRRFAPVLPRFIWDTMLVDQSMWGGYYESHSLRSLDRRELGVFMDKEIRNEFETATEMTPEMKTYAAADVDYTLQIAVKQRQDFGDSIYFNAYTNVDEPMIFPVLDMKPIKVNREGWEKYVVELALLAKETEAKLGINSYSHSQVIAEARKHHIHLKNTMGSTLLEFADSEFIMDVIIARRYRHAVSSYGLKWLADNLEENDLVYAACHITGAKTGRQSYSNPSMQNVPQRKLPHYRTLFISKYGKMIVSDITQQEPTILGWESQDPVLLAAIAAEEDLHQTVAKEIERDRDTGKVFNLGMSYGMSPKGVASRLGISEAAGNALVIKYFQKFKGVFSWISQKRQEAYKNGFVTTASHRRMFVNPHSRHADNNAINSPIQGGAADFTKVWQRKIWERRNEVPYEFMLSVHDEILNDPPPEHRKATMKAEDEAFHEAADVLYPNIKFRKETKVGATWACKKLKEGIEDDDEVEE